MRLEHPPPIITASSIRLFAASLRNVSLLLPLLHPSRSCFHVFRDLAVAFLPASFLRAWIRVNGCLDSSSDSNFSNLADSARIFRFRNGRGILNPLYTRALKRQINLENKPSRYHVPRVTRSTYRDMRRFTRRFLSSSPRQNRIDLDESKELLLNTKFRTRQHSVKSR